MNKTHDYTFVYPEGAIRTQDDLQVIIDKAINTNIPITIYAVMQSGYMSEIVVDNTSEITRKEGFVGLVLLNDSDYIFCGDHGLCGTEKVPSHESHRTFYRKEDALAYSNWMQTDETYKEAVRDWHEYVDNMFPDIRDIDPFNFD